WAVLEPGRIRKATLLEAGEEFIGLANALTDLADLLASSEIMEEVPSARLADVRKKRNRVASRAASTARRFAEIVTADFDDLVRWVEEETTRRGAKQMVLKSAPV